MKKNAVLIPTFIFFLTFIFICCLIVVIITGDTDFIPVFGGISLILGCVFSYKYAEKEQERDYRQCLLLLLAEVMKADKKNMVCELERVKSTIHRYYKTKEEQDAALKEFQFFLIDFSYKLENKGYEYFQNIQKLTFAAKSEIIMELLAVAYADDNFHTNEKFKIGYIISRLGITPQEYNSIKAIFIKKHKEGYYKSYAEQKSDQSKRNENSNNKSHNYNNNQESNSHNEYDNYKYSDKSRTQDSSNTSTKEKEAYDIIGVESNATDEEIKKAYRALAIKYHPDNAASLGDEAIHQATESMKQINMAWEVVKTARGIK